MKRTTPKYPPQRCIAIDVDGTLVIKRRLNKALVEWAATKKAEGFDVILWSSRGRRYAQSVAENYGVSEHFTAIIGKPGYIVDDKAWGWVKYTKVISKFNQLD